MRRIRTSIKLSVHATSLFRVNRRGGLQLDNPLTLEVKKYPKMVKTKRIMMKRANIMTKRSEL